VLWITLDLKPDGTITLRGGSGTMPTYNLGRFGVSNDDVRVYGALPDIGTSQQILIGGAFSSDTRDALGPTEVDRQLHA
jgi:hypothetical protein